MDRSTIHIQNCDELSIFYCQQDGFGTQRCWKIHEKTSTIQWKFRDPIDGGTVQDVPPVDSVQLVYKWLNSMVYGRYNYS